MSGAASRQTKALWLILLVLAVGLTVRVIYLAEYSSLPEWSRLTVDNWYHHNWARSLVFNDNLQHTTFFRAPVYTWCLAGLYTLFGASLWVGRLFGLAVGLISILLTYLIGRRVGGRSVGLIAASLHALYPVAIYFESELLLDPLFALLLQLAVHRFIVWLESPRPTYLLLCGGWLGLAAITRPTALVLLPIFLGMMLSHPIRRRNPAAHTLRQAALLVSGVVLVVTPVFVRNLVVAADPVPIASQGGINLYIGNNGSADGLSAVLPEPFGFNWQIRQITHVAEQAEGRALSPGKVSDYWGRQAWRWIADNPAQAAGLFFRKLYFQFSHNEVSNNRQLGAVWMKFPILNYNPLGFSLLFALAVVGALWGWRHSVALQVLLLVLVAYALAVSMFFFNSRFRLPLLPLYFVLSAAGLRSLLTLAVGNRRRLWGPLAVGAAASLFSLLPLVPPPDRASPQTFISQGLHYYANNEIRTALESFHRAKQISPEFPEVNLNLGACYFRLGEEDSARAFFAREIALHPSRHRAWLNLASLDLVSGRPAEALADARRSVALAPYDVMAQSVLLRTAAADSTCPTEMVTQLGDEALRATGGDLQVIYEGGAALIARGATGAAVTMLEGALGARPPAIETDDRAFAAGFDYDGSAFRRKQAAALGLLGYALGLEGRWNQAATACRSALERDSSLAQAWVNLATALDAEGRLVEADSVAAEAARRFPNHPALRLLQQP